MFGINGMNTMMIVLKFVTHIGSDSALSWFRGSLVTAQGHSIGINYDFGHFY